jgi:TonB family protein
MKSKTIKLKTQISMALVLSILGIITELTIFAYQNPNLESNTIIAVKAIAPIYPECSIKEGVEGKVEIKVHIDQNGDVLSSSYNDKPAIEGTPGVKGYKCLQETSSLIAKQWKFNSSKGLKDREHTITFEYKLIYEDEPIEGRAITFINSNKVIIKGLHPYKKIEVH